MAAGSATLLRALTDDKTDNPVVKCAYHALSDGTAVSIVADVGAIYVYKHSTQDMSATVTLAATIANDTAVGDAYIYASAVDTANGLHVAWRAHNYTLTYVHYAYTGSAYPTETNRITNINSGSSSSNMATRIDMDCAGSGTHQYTVVASYVLNLNTTQTNLNLLVVDDTNKVTYSNAFGIGNSTIPVTNSEDLTISCEKNGSIGTVGYIKIAVAYTRNWVSRGDTAGDMLQCYKFTVSGNSFSTGGSMSIPSQGRGGGKRKYCLFEAGNDTIFYLAGGAIGGWAYAYTFTLDASCNIVTRTRPSTRSASQPNMQGAGKNFLGFNRYADTVIIYSQTAYNAYAAHIVNFSAVDGSTTWFDTPILWQSNPGQNYAPGCVVGGNSRNPIPNMGTVCYWNGKSGSSFGAYYQGIGTPKAPVQVYPAANSKYTTGFPIFSARYKLAYDFSQVRFNMIWQWATDAAFTQNVSTVTGTPIVVTGAGTTNADIRMIATPAQAMISNTWYVRAAAVSELGVQGPWSSANLVQVATIPTSSNLAPNNDYVAVYGAGSVMFSWKFSDSAPYSAQSAYEIVVTRVSDGAAVVDTGKVAATANSANVAIPAAFKDTRLQWQLYLWDSDNQLSVASSPATFYASDPPSPAFTYPVAGAVITNGYPAVTWNNGVQGTKTQVSYRVQLLQGRTTLYDSGTVNSTATTQQIPSGKIKNNSNYTLRLTITDSLGEVGVVSSQFSTSYVVPASITTTTVYLYEMERKGFVFVGWTYPVADQDFVYFNLYRQEIGVDSGVVVATYGDLRSSYGYRDTTAKGNTRYRYWVTQVVNRYGDLIESAVPTPILVNSGGTNYWLSDSAGLLDPVPLLMVTADTWTDEHEENVSNVLGRGRHVDIGTRWGVNGTLTCELRDKYVGLTTGYNWLPNPSMKYNTDGYNPTSWTYGSSGTFNFRYDTFVEPAPDGQNASVISLWSDSLPQLGYLYWQAANVKLSDTDLIAGTSTACISGWVGRTDTYTGQLNVGVTFYAADQTTVIGAYSEAGAIQSDTYEPATSGDTGTGNWKRWVRLVAIPAGAVYMKVAYLWYNTSGGTVTSPTIYLGGMHMHSGTSPITYFDGDMIGGKWVDQPGGYSYNLGTYSAHDQRYRIKALKETNRPLFLRTPFGENYQVSVGDDGNNRIAGVGVADFDDITIPYREIAF